MINISNFVMGRKAIFDIPAEYKLCNNPVPCTPVPCVSALLGCFILCHNVAGTLNVCFETLVAHEKEST